LHQANQDLASSQVRLRALSQRLLEVQEAERRSIARELHDEVGQVLTGLKLMLDIASRAAPASAHHLHDAQGTASDLLERVRKLSLDLRPPMLDDMGLIPTLEWQLKRFTKQTGIRVHFQHSNLNCRFPSELETAVFRIVQEALTNVARHAGVREVMLKIEVGSDHLVLQIEDRGKGFDMHQVLVAPESNGLSGIRERAELLRGTFHLNSAPGEGTTLRVQVPLAASASATAGSSHA
jgi:signal transduction histidine kinase